MNGFPLRGVWLIASIGLMAGCGNPGGMTGNSTRELQSLTVTPATATASGSAVQFTATGHWSQAPLTETPMPATWGACTANGNTQSTDVTVTSAGVATCGSGATGNYVVYAWDPMYGYTGPVCNVVTACGPGCGRVAAQVQLTCP